MALKGTATIELTNVKTGEVEVVKHDNLVTNAVNDILGLNPDGYLYQGSYQLHNNMLPLCPNLFGGILLYENALEEDPSKYYAPDDNPLVGYSSNNVNAGTDIMRGSMNQTESGALADGSGYRFVFDFATSQANGSIAALGLTSKWGGLSGYGSELVGDQACVYLTEVSTSYTSDDFLEFQRYPAIVGFDLENDMAYSAYLWTTNTIHVCKIRAHLKKMGLLDSIGCRSRNIEGNTVITTSVFGSTLTNSYHYATFLYDGEGYIWGFEHSGNAQGNSGSTATVNWIKISVEDFSFTEGTWTLSAKLYRFGTRYTGFSSSNYSYSEYNHAVIKDGYLYCLNYGLTGVYKIELANPSNVLLMTHPSGSIPVPSASHYYGYNNCSSFNVLGNIVYFSNGYIVGDEIYPNAQYGLTGNSTRVSDSYPRGLKGGMGPVLCQGPFLMQYERQGESKTYVYLYRRVYLMTPYLATINNLAAPVMKTADKTMKITYILREE